MFCCAVLGNLPLTSKIVGLILSKTFSSLLKLSPYVKRVHNQHGHGFIEYPKSRNVERALGFSLTGTVSTSPNLAKARARRASNDCRATRSLFS